ncbi:MAG: hypothetical protein GX041_08625 [Clostridiales bacterium]|nr:hypothetical protein [Clostridiales bacterium]
MYRIYDIRNGSFFMFLMPEMGLEIVLLVSWNNGAFEIEINTELLF